LSLSGLAFAPQPLHTTSAPQTVTVTNNGTTNLIFTSISITGPNLGDFEIALGGTPCSTTSPVLASGGQCTINVTFTPSATGGRSAALTLVDNAASGQQSASLTGTGAAPLADVAPPNLTFSSQDVGTTSGAQQVTLSNTGATTLAITSIVASTNFGEADNCGGSVAAGAFCTINVTFSPTTSGPLAGTLTLTDNSNGVAGSTQTVNLNGTGAMGAPPVLNVSIAEVIHLTDTEPPAASWLATPLAIAEVIHVTDAEPPAASWLATPLTIAEVIHVTDAEPPATSWLAMPLTIAEVIHVSDQGPIGADVSFLHSSLTFPAEIVRTGSPAQPVVLTNTGAASLSISSITASGDFTQTNTCGTTVSAASNCTISVTFTPTAGGTRTGILSISDNADGSLQSVALNGTGLDFSFGALSGASLSATVAPGNPAIYNLSVAGEGGLSGTISFTCSGAPSGTTCGVSPNPAPLGSAATPVVATVETMAQAATAARSRRLPPALPLWPSSASLLLLGLGLAATTTWTIMRRNQSVMSRRRPAIALFAAGFLLTLALAGCAGPVTPTRTYTLTVTGTTGSGASALSHSVTLTLIVK
jgi:hypothetical protein